MIQVTDLTNYPELIQAFFFLIEFWLVHPSTLG
jgi:hypothetical protein